MPNSTAHEDLSKLKMNSTSLEERAQDHWGLGSNFQRPISIQRWNPAVNPPHLKSDQAQTFGWKFNEIQKPPTAVNTSQPSICVVFFILYLFWPERARVTRGVECNKQRQSLSLLLWALPVFNFLVTDNWRGVSRQKLPLAWNGWEIPVLCENTSNKWGNAPQADCSSQALQVMAQEISAGKSNLLHDPLVLPLMPAVSSKFKLWDSPNKKKKKKSLWNPFL